MTIIEIMLLILAAFIVVSLLYSSVKLGISPMPSSTKAFVAMQKLVDETGQGAIVDLGSGWGNFVIPMAKSNPHRQVIGYELSLLPWFISVMQKNILGLENLTLQRKNFFQGALPDAAVLVCYLYPAAMTKIAAKLTSEQPKIDFLISNNFALPSLQPSKVVNIDDFYKSPIYLYKINQQT